jgi:hypothetical protein
MNDDLDSMDFSIEEIEEVLQNLKAKGLLDEEMIDGAPHYKLNALGKAYLEHSKSDPKNQN